MLLAARNGLLRHLRQHKDVYYGGMQRNKSSNSSRSSSTRRLRFLLVLLVLLGGLAGLLNAEALQRWRYRGTPVADLVAQARTHPEDLLLLEITGERLLASDRALEARDLLLPAAESHPDRARLALLAGRAAWKSGEEARGGEFLRQAMERVPADPNARFWMAEFLRSRGYSHEAQDLFQEVTRLDPQYALAWCRWGEIEREDEHYEVALEKLERAEKLQPTADTAYHRAAVLQSLGRLAEAEAAARAAYARKRNVETATLLGQIVQLTPGPDRAREAQAYLQEAVRLDPAAVETLKLLALNQRSLGEHAAAVKTLRRMLRLAPASTDGYLLLGQSYQALGRPLLAGKCLAIYHGLEPLEVKVTRAEYQANIGKGSPPSQRALARAYLEAGRQDMARTVLTRLLRKQPEDVSAQDLLRQAQGPPTLKIAPLPPDPEGDRP